MVQTGCLQAPKELPDVEGCLVPGHVVFRADRLDDLVNRSPLIQQFPDSTADLVQDVGAVEVGDAAPDRYDEGLARDGSCDEILIFRKTVYRHAHAVHGTLLSSEVMNCPRVSGTRHFLSMKTQKFATRAT